MSTKTKKITIYTNEACPYCKRIKEELTNNNIEFENKLTSEFKDEWSKIIGLTGIPTVPTIYYKDNYFIPGRDFNNAAHLINIIKDFEVCNFPSETQILEKLKTLNYNISGAFRNLDELLRINFTQVIEQVENKLKIQDNEHESTD